MQAAPISHGTLLIAEPFLETDYFKRSVVLVCDHDATEGTVAFVLNKPQGIRVDEVIEGFPEFDAEIFLGGPVQTNTIHYLHNLGDLLEGSTRICQGVYWGGDYESLKFLISSKLIEPQHIRFFVGYSGWSAGQLDEEMQEPAWILSEMDANYLFKENPRNLWQKTMQDKGNYFDILADIPYEMIWN